MDNIKEKVLAGEITITKAAKYAKAMGISIEELMGWKPFIPEYAKADNYYRLYGKENAYDNQSTSERFLAHPTDVPGQTLQQDS